MANPTQVRHIRVVVDAGQSAKNLDSIAKGFGQLNRNVKATKDILTGFQSAFAGLAGASIFGFGAREIIGISDGIQLLKDRIRGLIPETESVVDTLSKINAVSTNTKSSLADTAGLFARVGVATKDLGLSTDAILALINGLQQSFRLSGATAEEASASTIQFTQALSLGTTRGQELRSILTQNSTLARVFAKIARDAGQDIYKFAEAGGFTNKVVLPALAKAFTDINARASLLGQTFGQTLTLAMNAFTIRLGEVSESLGINSKFAAGMQFLLDNTPKIGGYMAILATVAMPLLIGKFVTLGIVLGPVSLALTAIAVGLGYMAGSFDGFVLRITKGLEAMSFAANKTKKAFFELLDRIPIVQSSLSNVSDKLKQSAAASGEAARKNAASIYFIDQQLNRLNQSQKSSKDPAVNIEELNKKFQKESNNLKGTIKTIKQQLGELNTAYNQLGDPTQDQVKKFNEAVTKLKTKDLQQQLKLGAIGAERFREEIQQLGLENATREFRAGIISFEELERARKNFKIEELTRKFNEGKYPLREYNIEVARLNRDFGSRLYVELEEYVQRTGDLFQGLSRGVVQIFGHLEDAIFEFTKKGRFDFYKFAQAVLDDLNRILIRTLIIRSIAQGLSAAVGPGGGAAAQGIGSSGSYANLGGGGVAAAHGHAFQNGHIQAFASGGIVDSPTMFGYGGGRTGLMGEAGSEAILPLKRGKGGDLGVVASGAVNINIINTTGANVETRESVSSDGERQVDVLIAQSFKRSLEGGSFDRALGKQFGLTRKGS